MTFWLLSLPTFAVAQGTGTKQKHFGNDELGIAATEGVLQDRSFGTDVDMSLGSLECQSPECTSGVKFCVGRWKPGCHTAGKKHVNSSYVILLFVEACIWVLACSLIIESVN